MGALALVLLVPQVARAAVPVSDAQDEAMRLFQQAEQAYEDGRYSQAVALLQQLIETHPDPVLYYNLGRAHERLGHVAEALQAYELYLREAPDAPDSETIHERVLRLRLSLQLDEDEGHDEAPEPVASPPEKPNDRSRPRARAGPSAADVVPWILFGVGGGGLVTGAVMGGLSRVHRRRASEEPTQTGAFEALERARRFALGANIALGVGGALAVAGLTWGAVRLARRSPSKRRVAWGPSLHTTSLGFVVRGRF
jgi:tetratricopeptide (TPR) repeat protein